MIDPRLCLALVAVGGYGVVGLYLTRDCPGIWAKTWRCLAVSVIAANAAILLILVLRGLSPQ